VRTLFAYHNLGSVLSPFLLLDYAGPMEFMPTDERRGVGEHPHRGFETVTIVYEGEVEHRDSSLIAGTITSVCLAFPSICAAQAGYKVFAVIDASGTLSKMV
jgi:hypothetical protein